MANFPPTRYDERMYGCTNVVRGDMELLFSAGFKLEEIDYAKLSSSPEERTKFTKFRQAFYKLPF